MIKDWFEWNGVRCTEYGMHVLEQPPLTMPAERVTFTDVPGRSGSFTTLEGEDVYADMVLTAQCMIADPERIPTLCGWLKGGGKVTFANRPGGFYHARINNQISFEKILRGNPHRSFAVNFRCKPFWYQAGVEPITLTTSGNTITNPGNVFSEPIITVHGTGDLTLMVGTTIIELEGIEGSITLDTPLMEAYSGIVSMNGCMRGEFPVLKTGMNAVSWVGDAGKVVIEPNWRHVI